jgi:large subunit ribosomal protein L21
VREKEPIMFAVVKAGGKQYRVAANDVLRLEKISGEPGDIIELGKVLMFSGDDGLKIGAPFVEGVTVAAEVLAQEKADTIIVFKKRRRHHYRRRNGHRQALTAIRVTEILTNGQKPEKRKAANPSTLVEKPPEPTVEAKTAKAKAPEAKSPKKAPAKRTKPQATAKPKSAAGKSKPKTK